MATLFNTRIKDTYEGLLKFADNNAITIGYKKVTDGEGTDSSLSLAIGKAAFDGILDLTNATVLGLSSGSVDSVNGLTGAVILTTTEINEGSNLYFTDARVTANASVYANTQKVSFPEAPNDGLQYARQSEGWAQITAGGLVDSVNGQTGAVVLTTTDIAEGTNLYFTDARVSSNSDVTANTLKVGITSQQAADITANNTKVGITTQQATDISANNLKVGITTQQANDIAANTLKTGITSQQAADITANNSKRTYPQADETKLSGIEAGAEVNVFSSLSVNGTSGDATLVNGVLNIPNYASGGGGGAVDSVNSYTGVVVLDTDDISEGTSNLYFTDARVSANTSVAANTLKVGITQQQADDITANNLKVGITTAQANEIAANTLKVGITPTQAADITANNSKVGITTQQAADITTNNSKVGITPAQAQDITDNNAKVGITTAQSNEIAANTLKNTYPPADATKLAGIETGAQVNDVDSVNGLTGAVSLGLLDLDDVGSDGISGQVLTTNGSGSFTFTTVSSGGGSVNSVTGTGTVSGLTLTTGGTATDPVLTLGGTLSAPVNSVNGQTGTVTLDTDNVSEGAANLYYTDARVSANSSVAANTSKVGITTQQAADITANNSKVGITTNQANEITANTQKVGISTQQAADIQTNNSKVGITQAQADDITANNSKVGITTAQANEIAANTLKVGITQAQADDITANNLKVGITQAQADDIVDNNAKVSFVDAPNNTSLYGRKGGAWEVVTSSTPPVDSVNTQTGVVVLGTDDIAEGSTNLYYTEARVSANTSVTANTSKVGITTAQSNEIAANTLKVSNVQSDWNATSGLAQILNKPTIPGAAPVDSVNTKTGVVVLTTSDIAEGSNLYFTDARVSNNSAVSLNTAKVGITTSQSSDITANNLKVSNVQSDWNATTGLAVILNKPTIPSAAPVDSVNGLTGAVTLDTDDINEGTNNLYFTDSRVTNNSAVSLNTAKVGITTQQAADINTNNSKVGITTSERLAIVDNSAKVSNVQSDWNATSGLAEILNKPTIPAAAPVDSVNTLTGAVVLTTTNIAEGNNLYYTEARVTANTSVADNTAKNSYPSADATKLSGIETGAQVNVQSDWNATTGDAFIQNKPNIPAPAPVDSVNGDTGAVTLDTDDIAEGTNNLYYTEARVSANTNVSNNTTKLNGIESGAEVNTIDSDNSAGGTQILNVVSMTIGQYTGATKVATTLYIIT